MPHCGQSNVKDKVTMLCFRIALLNKLIQRNVRDIESQIQTSLVSTIQNIIEPLEVFTNYVMFYGLTAGTGNPGPGTDYAATIAVGARVPFPRDGPTSGDTVRADGSSFILSAVGTYRVIFRVHTTEPGQLQLELNGSGLIETTSANANLDATGHPIVGYALITTTVPNSTLAVINPPGNTTALTITPADGALTHANAQNIIIEQIA